MVSLVIMYVMVMVVSGCSDGGDGFPGRLWWWVVLVVVVSVVRDGDACCGR